MITQLLWGNCRSSLADLSPNNHFEQMHIALYREANTSPGVDQRTRNENQETRKCFQLYEFDRPKWRKPLLGKYLSAYANYIGSSNDQSLWLLIGPLENIPNCQLESHSLLLCLPPVSVGRSVGWSDDNNDDPICALTTDCLIKRNELEKER